MRWVISVVLCAVCTAHQQHHKFDEVKLRRFGDQLAKFERKLYNCEDWVSRIEQCHPAGAAQYDVKEYDAVADEGLALFSK